MRVDWKNLSRRLQAGVLAAGTLWVVTVTAGSDTAASALSAVREALPLGILRWELGDLWAEDQLSPAVAMTLGESPLLAAARPLVAELRRQEETEEDTPEEEIETVPVEETPLDAPEAADNGVPARTLVPTDPSGYTVVGRAYITNTTDHQLSVPELQENFAAVLTPEEPQILILHTHGSEAYTMPEGQEYAASGESRTLDTEYNVVRVGDEIASVFEEHGISVLHDRTLYDAAGYNDAYDRADDAIQAYLQKYPSIHFVLDIHRDAIEDSAGTSYKVISQVDGKNAAQLSIVVGTDGSGAPHDHWEENLKLAVLLQQHLTERYPTLMRPMYLRNSRYNEHATTGSLLVEVGAAGNSLDEALYAARLFAEGAVEVFETLR